MLRGKNLQDFTGNLLPLFRKSGSTFSDKWQHFSGKALPLLDKTLSAAPKNCRKNE